MASKQTGHLPDKPFSFGLKLSFQKKRNINKDLVTMECKEDGHDKYYNLTLRPRGSQFDVIIHFGRNGTMGNNKTHTFDTREEAYKLINKKIGEKTKKGYKHITK